MWIDLWYCRTIINTNGYMCVVNTAECLPQAENGWQQLHVAYGICGGEYSPFSLSLCVGHFSSGNVSINEEITNKKTCTVRDYSLMGVNVLTFHVCTMLVPPLHFNASYSAPQANSGKISLEKIMWFFFSFSYSSRFFCLG